MDEYREFVKSLYAMFKDMNRYYPTEGVQQLIGVFDKLDMGKVMLRFLNTMRTYEHQLKNRDETIFNKSIILFPDVDVSEIWQNLTDKQKDKIWTYLQILYIQSELLLNREEIEGQTDKSVVVKNMQNDVENHKVEFNAYEGVGSNEPENYNVNEMFSGMDKLDDSNYTPGISSLMKNMGIEKMLNIEKLSEQLKNMKKEDIDEATKNIKGLFGDNIDNNTQEALSNMLHNITDELKKKDISEGNPIENIIKIAETVASNIGPKLMEKNVDMSKLWGQTRNMTNNFKDKEGNNPFNANNNPLNLLEKMMGMMNNPNQNQDDTKECLNQADMLFKNMGINMNQFMNQANQNTKKPSRPARR